MINLLKKYERWKDYFKLRASEVYLSIIVTFVFMFAIKWIGMHNYFNDFISIVESIINSLIAGMLVLIGMALSGVAVITGLFSQDAVEVIEKINGKEIFERLMSSFLFLALSCAGYIFYGLLLMLIINSRIGLANEYVFWAIAVITVYFAAFNILYTVSLVSNCIRIFSIRNTYEKIKEKSFYDSANEIRIDYILLGIMKKYGISQEEFLSDLDEIIEKSKVADGKNISRYFHQRYTGEK